jgi:uncharacterized delta-60 repeat protein
MTRKLLRIALPVLCMALAQCTASTTTSSGPPTAFATLRLNATTGVGDSTFGPNKTIVVTDIDPSLIDFALAVAIQTIATDNKIVVAGSNGLAGQGQIALVRYNSDGSIDTTFGGTGIVRTLLASPAAAASIAVQPADNKILVAALTFTPATSATSITVIRYNPDGSLDTTGFTPQGLVNAAIGFGLPGDSCALALQGDGKIVVVGAAQDGTVVLYRYNADGSLDTTGFGTGGKSTVTLGANASNPKERVPSIALQSDGRIVVAARSNDDQALLRFNTDGSQDTTFGGVTGGVVITDIGGSINYANAVAVQDASGAAANTDKIIVAGHTGVTDSTSDISLVRYTKDGALDGTFGTGGIVTTDIFGQFDNAIGILMQDQAGAEPKILVSGNTGFGSATQTFVFRYNSDGSGDVNFGSRATGLVLVPNVGPSTVASGNAMAIQNGGGIIVTGYD